MCSSFRFALHTYGRRKKMPLMRRSRLDRGSLAVRHWLQTGYCLTLNRVGQGFSSDNKQRFPYGLVISGKAVIKIR